MKRCTKCGVEKDEREFAKAKAYKDGLRYECKSCLKIYRIINAAKIKKSAQKYRTENYDKYVERNSKHNEAYHLKHLASAKKFRLANKEKCNNATNNYRVNNKQYYSERQKYYRENLHPEYLKNLLRMQGIPISLIKQYPVLIELEKQKILTRRTIIKQTK